MALFSSAVDDLEPVGLGCRPSCGHFSGTWSACSAANPRTPECPWGRASDLRSGPNLALLSTGRSLVHWRCWSAVRRIDSEICQQMSLLVVVLVSGRRLRPARAWPRNGQLVSGRPLGGGTGHLLDANAKERMSRATKVRRRAQIVERLESL